MVNCVLFYKSRSASTVAGGSGRILHRGRRLGRRGLDITTTAEEKGVECMLAPVYHVELRT